MRAVDVIRNKRDGHALSAPQIDAFVRGRRRAGTWPDYQLAALLMAIVLRGMDADETARLTGAMARSGDRLDLSDLPGPEGGQALHRRRRRQDLAHPRPARRRVRGARADDVRPRPGPHRRHARQARSRSPASASTCRLDEFRDGRRAASAAS